MVIWDLDSSEETTKFFHQSKFLLNDHFHWILMMPGCMSNESLRFLGRFVFFTTWTIKCQNTIQGLIYFLHFFCKANHHRIFVIVPDAHRDHLWYSGWTIFFEVSRIGFRQQFRKRLHLVGEIVVEIIFRAFDELGVKTKQFARVVFGVLVVEDIVVILLMVLLSTIAAIMFSGCVFSWADVYWS